MQYEQHIVLFLFSIIDKEKELAEIFYLILFIWSTELVLLVDQGPKNRLLTLLKKKNHSLCLNNNSRALIMKQHGYCSDGRRKWRRVLLPRRRSGLQYWRMFLLWTFCLNRIFHCLFILSVSSGIHEFYES